MPTLLRTILNLSRKTSFQKIISRDCGLGVHTASNQVNERNFEYYWGYKNHVLVDCITGLLIFELTTTADVYDSIVSLDILNQTNSFLSIHECTFITDKTYDVKTIYTPSKIFIAENVRFRLINAIPKIPKSFQADTLFVKRGLMHKDGKFSDNGRTCQKYCCPFRQSKTSVCPCNHKNWNNGKKNSGCTKYITLPDDYRLSIDRECISLKKIYALRTEAKRYNARFKQTGQERLWVRNFNVAQNLNTIAHIALLLLLLILKLLLAV